MVQFMLSDPIALVLARFSQAKAVISSLLLPNLTKDNSFWLEAPVIKFEAPHMYELFGEAMIYKQGRVKARKIAFQHTPLESMIDSVDFAAENFLPSSALTVVGQKRKKPTTKEGGTTPDCTTQVRRSARCNNYNGFKPKIISDAKAMKSKVKPRKTPSITSADVVEDNGSEEGFGQQIVASPLQVPPITPVPVMQAIGINLCGISPKELSPRKLLASLQEEEENN
jgi:hypothetical protein